MTKKHLNSLLSLCLQPAGHIYRDAIIPYSLLSSFLYGCNNCTRSESTHRQSSNKQAKSTKMPNFVLYSLSFSMVAITKPSQKNKNNKDVTITYSLLRFLLYWCNYKSIEHTMAPNQPVEQKQQRWHNTSFSVNFPSLWLQPQEQRTHTQWH